ncbi:MAG: DUF2911 domain-containing protein [Planctomycetes bacterium]|nr:DUF2911 domain-containing protein [Planctomycetota bacterium]
MKPMTALSLALLALLAFPAARAQEGAPPSASQLTKTMSAQLQKQDWAGAMQTAKSLLEIDEKNGQAWHGLGLALHSLGRLDEALEAHVKASTSSNPNIGPVACYNAACVHALKGQKDEAFAWLDKALNAGFTGFDHMATDPDMDGLRDDPRYQKFVEESGKTAAKGGISAFSGTSPRESCRVRFWSQAKGPVGQIVIDYGPVAWKKEYEEKLQSAEFKDTRWRLGSDHWTNLDVNVSVQIGGQDVPAGLYYVVLERKEGDTYSLVLLDPEEVRAKRLDAYLAQYTTGGIVVPLEVVETESVADALTIDINVDTKKDNTGKVVVHFGPHMLAAPVKVRLES